MLNRLESEINFMFLQWRSRTNHDHRRGFTLVEVLISFCILCLVISGLLFGYTQINRMAEFSSMSLAAQSFASEGLEQARSAQWNYVRWPNTNYGLGTGDDLGFPIGSNWTTNISDYLDVPTTGTPIPITDYITITYVDNTLYPSNPPLRQIRSDVVWQYPWDGTLATNTAIEVRATDQ